MEPEDFEKIKPRTDVIDQLQLETYRIQYWKNICLAHNLVFDYGNDCPRCTEAATSAWSEEIK
jgi:hypothetical protein